MKTAALLASCAMAACTTQDSPHDTQAPLQNAAPAGTGTSAGSSADAGQEATCEERSAAASAAVRAAIDSADPSCSVKSDCSNIAVNSLCSISCGATLSRAQASAADAAIAQQNQGVCKGFAADGCHAVPPPCPGPGHDDFDCIDGRCVWPVPVTDADASIDAADAAVSQPPVNPHAVDEGADITGHICHPAFHDGRACDSAFAAATICQESEAPSLLSRGSAVTSGCYYFCPDVPDCTELSVTEAAALLCQYAAANDIVMSLGLRTLCGPDLETPFGPCCFGIDANTLFN